MTAQTAAFPFARPQQSSRSRLPCDRRFRIEKSGEEVQEEASEGARQAPGSNREVLLLGGRGVACYGTPGGRA